MSDVKCVCVCVCFYTTVAKRSRVLETFKAMIDVCNKYCIPLCRQGTKQRRAVPIPSLFYLRNRDNFLLYIDMIYIHKHEYALYDSNRVAITCASEVMMPSIGANQTEVMNIV